MYQFLRYLFYPNPATIHYGNPVVTGVLAGCVLLMIASFAISYWRKRQANAVTRKLSKSWASAAFWFGLIGLVLMISRVEQIQFIAMRFTWVLWGLIAVLYVFFQARRYRVRHYEVLPTPVSHDPRDAYLPKKKHR